jgi:hypothetical protein
MLDTFCWGGMLVAWIVIYANVFDPPLRRWAGKLFGVQVKPGRGWIVIKGEASQGKRLLIHTFFALAGIVAIVPMALLLDWLARQIVTALSGG